MSRLTFGVIGSSHKENEHRVPIHPEHVSWMPEDVRRHLIFEKGYGEPFGVADADLAKLTGGVATRNEILAETGAVILLKPEPDDLEVLREGGILWGWVHCVQNRSITQIAIERKQTLLAFEDMFVWGPIGQIGRHIFYKNNEIAGYCGVLHAMQLKGIDGLYGKPRKILIFGFGAVSHGAIYALQAFGFQDITICLDRPDFDVKEEVPGCHYVRLREGREDEARMLVMEQDGSNHPLTELISQSDILINATFQMPEHPKMFITGNEVSCLKPGALIIDVSCDEGMGFSFARPTTFDDPMFEIGSADYYAVDHTPSYLWESASRVISAALIPYIEIVTAGRARWREDETLNYCVNIDEGVIQKESILDFQNRRKEYPHAEI